MKRALEVIRSTSKEPSIVAVADSALGAEPQHSKFDRELAAYRMRFVDRKSYREIAAVLPRADGTVGVTAAHAREIVLSAAKRLSRRNAVKAGPKKPPGPSV
jgi:hypothetical protein